MRNAPTIATFFSSKYVAHFEVAFSTWLCGLTQQCFHGGNSDVFILVWSFILLYAYTHFIWARTELIAPQLLQHSVQLRGGDDSILQRLTLFLSVPKCYSSFIIYHRLFTVGNGFVPPKWNLDIKLSRPITHLNVSVYFIVLIFMHWSDSDIDRLRNIQWATDLIVMIYLTKLENF